MRLLPALALVLAACGPADRSDPSASHDAPSASSARGPDPLVLRVSRSGGRARVYAYGQLDSLVWSAPGVPRRVDGIIGFDPEQGIISFVDDRNVPGRIDLRTSEVSQAGARFTLASARSADGGPVYGVAAGGEVVRFTETGAAWEFDPRGDVSRVFPQPDGSLIVMAAPQDGSAQLWRVFPPQTRVLDSTSVHGLRDGPRIQGGDRLYFASDSGLVVVETRTLDPAAPIALETAVRDMVATPSGDRLFIATEGDTAIRVFERYQGQLGGGVALPSEPRAVRMDPLGRYLLVRPLSGDSAWVVAVGTRKVIGTVKTSWRRDLPFVGPDGAVATAQGADVVFIDGSTMRPVARVGGGTADFWYPFQWSGFRPRAEGIDQPVEFAVGSDSTADSLAVPGDSAASSQPAVQPRETPAASGPQWLVSFAALLVESSAQTLAEEISIEGQDARVVTSLRDGTPVHRVVIGPFSNRDAAERIGRASGRPYWVYAATP